MEGLTVEELLKALRDKLLETHEELTLKYMDPVSEFTGSQEDLGSGVHFLYFTADWCAPCVSFLETIRLVARKYKGKAGFYKVNIDKRMDVVDLFNVDYIPAFIAVVDGVAVDRVYGIVGYNRIEDLVKKTLSSHRGSQLRG